MTDDIVERLRSFAELGDIGSVAMEDAADEIVNLRAALNWLRGWRTKDHESIDCTIQHALGGAETCDVCHPHGSEALPASAGTSIAESNDRADAALASMDSEDAARFRWLCDDHDDRAVRHLRDSLIERMSVMSLSAVRAAIDIHLKNPSEPSHRPGTCRQCGRYLDRRGRCRFQEHNA